MRILFIDSNYGVGSTGKLVQSLHESFLSTGNESIAVYGREGFKSRGVYKISSRFEVIFHVVLTRLTGIYGIWSPFATRRLFNLINIFKPDVIHIHELHGYYVNYFQVINFISKKNIPLVWTLHSEFDFTGKCGYSYSCIKWQKECNFCPQVDVYPKSLYFDFSKYLFRKKKNVFSNLQKVIFVPVSNWLDNKKKLSFLKDFNSTIVYNGIDTIKTFYPKYKNNHYEAIKSNGEFIVLSVAPDIFSDRKGGKTILDIAERLKHLPIKFVLVGTDESQTSKQENVIYISLIKDQKRLSEVYSISDLFLLTSKFETFSLTTIESLACGVPVIGYDCGGATEIAPPPFGNFIPYGDIEGLTQLISECYSKKFSLPSKDECVNFIKKNYSSNKMFNKYFSIYNNIANN